MRTALQLAPRLALERLRSSRGGGVLDFLAVVAFTVSSCLTLTVVGGTWMFVQRRQNPASNISSLFDEMPGAEAAFLETYVILATIACALLVLPVLSLGAAAARLGARGRSRRLASLRLVGMSGRDIVAMSVVETLVQSIVGLVVGAALWFSSLLLWTGVQFHGEHIRVTEMVGPWWLLVTVAVALLTLGALSTVFGLRRVRISPLGVANQQTPKRLRVWRLVFFVAAIIGFTVFAQSFSDRVTQLDLSVYSVVAAMILLVVIALNVVGPWVLQLLARPGTRTSSVPRLIAARRIIDDPRSAWRNVAGIALLGLIATFVTLIRVSEETLGDDQINRVFIADLRTGTIITLGVGLVVAATSTLVNQASIVVDRADETVAMTRAGYPTSVFNSIRRQHVLVPLILTLSISVAVGVVLASPFLVVFGVDWSGAAFIAATGAAGIALTAAAAESCRPVQRLVIGSVRRRND